MGSVVNPLPADILNKEDGRWVHRVRQSGLGDYFHMCAERLRVQHVGLVPRTTSGEAAVGTGLHAAIEHCCNAMKRGVVFDSEEAIETGFHAYDQEARTPGFTDLRKGNPYLLIHQAFAKWYTQVLPKIGEVLAIEWHFEDLPIYEDSERVILGSGTVDFVESGAITDWKTASKTWKWDAWEKKRWGIQPSMYVPAWERHSGERLPFVWWVFVHGQDAVERYETTKGLEHDAWFAEQCKNYAEQAEAYQQGALREWMKNDGGWWCNDQWCGNWARCKGANGITY